MGGQVNPTQELTGNETAREIIEIALEAEKEMVVFYVGLKDMVHFKVEKGQVEEIIIEELGHIRTLLKQLKALD